MVGALATYRDLQLSADVTGRIPVLGEVAGIIGDPQVRARGTLAGSLAHADPAGDMPAVVLAFGATIKAIGPGGPREYHADDFFVDMMTTELAENEIITEVRFPIPGKGTGAGSSGG